MVDRVREGYDVEGDSGAFEGYNETTTYRRVRTKRNERDVGVPSCHTGDWGRVAVTSVSKLSVSWSFEVVRSWDENVITTYLLFSRKT